MPKGNGRILFKSISVNRAIHALIKPEHIG